MSDLKNELQNLKEPFELQYDKAVIYTFKIIMRR